MTDTPRSVSPFAPALPLVKPFRLPLRSNRIRKGSIAHTYGWVRSTAYGAPARHDGWDFYAEPGTEAFAVGDGVIAFVRDTGDQDYGLQLAIQLDKPVRSEKHGEVQTWAFYAHLQDVKVIEGQRVKRGDVVALTGRSGNASRLSDPADDHLHFECRIKPRPAKGEGDAARFTPLDMFGVCPRKDAVEES